MRQTSAFTGVLDRFSHYNPIGGTPGGCFHEYGFGEGKGYVDFKYDQMTMSGTSGRSNQASIASAQGGGITVSVRVTNTGLINGIPTAFDFTNTMESSASTFEALSLLFV